MSNCEQDRLYATPQQRVQRFVFDDRVASVFSDMISRSVPGYSSVIDMTGILAAQHAQEGTRLYDLGCSLGAATAAMCLHLPARGRYNIIAVDNAPSMLQRAQQNLQDQGEYPIEFLCADIRDVEIYDASVVVLNFTLQFLPLEQRQMLLQRIRSGMTPGGVLILSEKFKGADGRKERVLNEMHLAFKRANGYSDMEISQKRTALENVLIPDTLETHHQRLHDAGFSRVDQWFQCCNFVSIIARP